MKKPTLLVIIVVAALVVVGAVVASSSKKTNTMPMPHSDTSKSASTSSDKPMANEVFIKGFAFGPAKMTIKKGTKVTWTNKDDAHHDISPDKASPDFTASELLSNGQSYSYTFNTAGSYSYHCTPHPYMKAVIEVTE